MSCWVAPSIAAEIWGVTLADVASLISAGALATEASGPFSFIRLPRYCAPGVSIPPSLRPPTYNCIASKPTPPQPEPEPAATKIDSTPIVDEDSELGPPPDEDPNDNRIAGWRAGRQASATRRRPPGARSSHDPCSLK